MSHFNFIYFQMDWKIALVLLFVCMDISSTNQIDTGSGGGLIIVCPYITLNETISPVNCLPREQFPSAEVQATTRIPIDGNEFSSVFVS